MIPKAHPWPDVYRGVDARGWWPVTGVDLAAASWPYYALARYSDEADEWGAGTLDRYLSDGVQYARAAWEAVRPGGYMIVNLGDTRANTGGSGEQVKRRGQRAYRQDRSHGVEGRQWLMVPSRAALAVQAETSWQLSSEIVWRKPTPNQSDHGTYQTARNRRVGYQHEMIYVFWKPDGTKKGDTRTFDVDAAFELGADGDVWDLPRRTSRPSWAARSDDVKAWPDELCERLVRLYTRPGDLVADPCAGYGTLPRVADYLGRRGWAADLYWGRADLPGAAAAIASATARKVAAEREAEVSARTAELFAAAG